MVGLSSATETAKSNHAQSLCPSSLCQNPNFGAQKPLRHSRESGNPGVLEGSLRGVSPLHPAWIPAFAGMTISGVGTSLG